MDLAAFVERFRSEPEFADLVRLDPDASFDDAGLSPEERRRARRIVAGIGSFEEFFER
jgi:hypothetical protein